MRSEEAPTRSRWTAPARDPLFELKWGLALLGEEGRTAYLAWLNKHMKLLPSSDPRESSHPSRDERRMRLLALLARLPYLAEVGPSSLGAETTDAEKRGVSPSQHVRASSDGATWTPGAWNGTLPSHPQRPTEAQPASLAQMIPSDPDARA